MKFVYFFGDNKTEGKKELKELLGGKGANLAEMANIGIPVPPGFTISTVACKQYFENNKSLNEELTEEIEDNIKKIEESMGKRFGDRKNPLLLSVRSGAAVSMPGMMDSILNLGLNDEIVNGLAEQSRDPRFAWDSYRRFIQMYGNVVMGIKHRDFENILDEVKKEKQIKYDFELDSESLKYITQRFKELIEKKKHVKFPQDVKQQLILAIRSVFDSWNNPRAINYRKINEITGLEGTAVNVQTMVFGNLGEESGTGVCFSRNPATGENRFYGEFLMNAQGEDVVAGIRTPQRIELLKQKWPDCYKELLSICKKVEKHYREMQDMEFTIQNKKLYILQTRTGKCTAQAAVKIAVEMVKEGMISKKEALLRIKPKQLTQFLHKQLDITPEIEEKFLGKGLPASPGAAVGTLVFDNETAVEMSKEDKPVILVRNETSPEDIMGMDVAKGILTVKGGMTSHAAVVARGMGKCCITGCKEIEIDETEKTLFVNSKKLKQGDHITLDGNTGKVYDGKLATTDPEVSGDFSKILEWADESRTLSVRANADTPRDAKKAIKFGAEGIGLCRTEHMFFQGERIKEVRKMIVAEDEVSRKKALSSLEPFQRSDFIELFKIMEGRPITIRLLDPPLHEFLPKEERDIEEVAREIDVPIEKLKEKISQLSEINPMLGHRGCRIGISHPEIPEMQARAIFEAAKIVSSSEIKVQIEIMVPLVGHTEEFIHQKKIIDAVAEEVLGDKYKINYKVGTMIEVPRAALRADGIAKNADFFSFGTNDLTQMTSGFSRDDVGKFIPRYIEKGLFKFDPFQILDQTGVGQLIEIAVDKGRSIKENLKIGICGEQGGEPSSIEFCHKTGLDYVSCSPYQVPVAILASAQAAFENL